MPPQAGPNHRLRLAVLAGAWCRPARPRTIADRARLPAAGTQGRVKVSIGQRLFIATFGALLLLALVGLAGAVRWTLLDNFAAGTRSLEAQWTPSWRRCSTCWKNATARPVTGGSSRCAGARRGVVCAMPRPQQPAPSLAARPPWASASPCSTPTGNCWPASGRGHLLRTFASIDTWVRPLGVGTHRRLPADGGARARGRQLAVAFLMDQQEHLLWLAALGVGDGRGVAAAGHVAAPADPSAGRRCAAAGAGALRDAPGRASPRRTGRAGTAFNRLPRACRRDEQRRWVADSSHELRTPLAVLQAQTALADGVRAATHSRCS